MTEFKDNLQPILKVISENLLPHSAGVDYIKTNYNLIMKDYFKSLYPKAIYPQYILEINSVSAFTRCCTQIGYYLVLKSKRISVQNHPVIKRLVQFRSLLHQLENAGTKLQPEIDDLLEKIRLGKPLSNVEICSVAPQQPPQKKLRILGKPKAVEPNVSEKTKQPTKQKAVSVELTRDEQDAVQFYKAVRQQKENSESEGDTDEDKPARDAPVADIQENEEQETGKRAINYQISKNKGLTPHRSKEQRNPRVKHRMKFRKAQIRRKGAIREPRKELKRYGGEMSGIKATVVRSVKLK
jgi:U3 small nucleolar RNA-associated protein 3